VVCYSGLRLQLGVWVALGHDGGGGVILGIEVLANEIYKSFPSIFYFYPSFCICEQCKWDDVYLFIEKA
jgi:hypothetical protein